MLEQEDYVEVGGAGWMALKPVTPEQAMDVIGGRAVEDNHYRNACQWALILFDYPDFVGDMPVDAKRQLFELIENNRGTQYAAIRNYVAEAVEDIVREGNE